MPLPQKPQDQEDSILERARKNVDDQALLVRNLEKEGRDAHTAERLLTIYRELLDVLTPS